MDRSRFLRIGRKIVSGLLVFLIIILLISVIIYPPEYVFRVLTRFDAGYEDIDYFDTREIASSAIPFEFETGIDPDTLRKFSELGIVDNMETWLEDSKTAAFLVIENDTLLYEGYFNGYTRESIVTSFSVAKSVDALLIGIASDQGLLSIEDPITNYLPELLDRDSRFADISIRDLMLMSSGIKYKEFPWLNGDDAKTYYWPNLRQLALEQTEIEEEPGLHFHYNNYHPLLIGLILERVSQMSVSQYMEEMIWTKIGSEFGANWSLDSEGGFEKMESGINARAIDFAKLGKLVMDGGQFNGVEVVSQVFVTEMISAPVVEDYNLYYYDDFIFSDGSGFYSYFWWGTEQGIMALGNHGQFIYLCPEKDLMILRFGESYGSIEGAWPWVKLFEGFIR
ncbi:MAG: serine hydrolase domain-containing protein [Candidatus Kariarchaeaceae archaeon]|jgi:CubicO group peptidase (beta-lactamase class C family)